MPEQIRYSKKRNRAYKRLFDYDEAARLIATGLTQKQVAALLGVTRTAIGHALRNRNRTSVVNEFVPLDRRCDICGGKKARKSVHCRTCNHRLRLTELVKVEHEERKDMMLGGVEAGRIVIHQGRYAVVERHGNDTNSNFRKLDFWEGPSERVSSDEVVDQMAYTEWVEK